MANAVPSFVLASVGSAAINPITSLNSDQDYQTILIDGTRSPGAIAQDGIQGFDREIGWDVQQGKGIAGATLIRTSQPPARGTIEFLLWTAAHFAAWGSFRSSLISAKIGGNSLTIYYPTFADINLTSVVVNKISPITHKGRKLYSVTVEFIEWLKPVASPPKQTQKSLGTPPNPPGDTPDPQDVTISGLNARFMGQGALP